MLLEHDPVQPATPSDWNENVCGKLETLLRILNIAERKTVGKMKSWDKAPNWSKGVRKGRQLCQMWYFIFAFVPGTTPSQDKKELWGIYESLIHNHIRHLPAVEPWLVTYSHFTGVPVEAWKATSNLSALLGRLHFLTCTYVRCQQPYPHPCQHHYFSDSWRRILYVLFSYMYPMSSITHT